MNEEDRERTEEVQRLMAGNTVAWTETEQLDDEHSARRDGTSKIDPTGSSAGPETFTPWAVGKDDA